ncbi:RNA-binding protein [Fluviicola sp.]|uniref:RNA recognition motif domain-containing protein n=1 Tax=Fluviicola sp. TaxID=1917219 RepID=UPI0031D3AD8A
MTNIFIANLDWEITSEDLQATFSAFGAVHLAHVVFDAKTKQSKGFGYVEMESAEEAINAIQALNGFEVNGRKLDVKIASPKANRPKPEDKPKKPSYGNKQGGFGGQKKFNNNGPRQGGGGGGSYRSNDRNSNYNREGGSGNSNYNRNEGGNSNYNRNDRNDRNEGGNSNSGSGERQMRPRRKFDN